MKKKSIMVSLFILILFSLTPFLAKAETETVLEEYNITFEWGYVYYFTEKTPAKSTEVNLEISSDQPLTFFVSKDGDAENYANGEEIDVYYVQYNILEVSLSFVLDEKRSYDFAFDNMNMNNSDAYIDRVIITFTYEPSGINSIVWIVIIAAVVGIVIIIIRKSRRQSPGYVQPPQYSSYEPPSTLQQSYQQPTSPVKYCTNCGATNEDSAMFCTNCGAKLT